MVPMRHVGGSGLDVSGMGMQSVLPVPGSHPSPRHTTFWEEGGFQINAFPEVFGDITVLPMKLWRNIAATVGGVTWASLPIVFASKRPHDMRKM